MTAFLAILFVLTLIAWRFADARAREWRRAAADAKEIADEWKQTAKYWHHVATGDEILDAEILEEIEG